MQSMLSKGIFCWRLALVLTACIFVAIATPLSAADTSTPIATPAAEPVSNYGAWRLDLTARDSNVRPGADFYGYANGHWRKSNTIPPDRVNVW